MENLNKTRIVRVLRIIMPIVGIIIAVVIAPSPYGAAVDSTLARYGARAGQRCG